MGCKLVDYYNLENKMVENYGLELDDFACLGTMVGVRLVLADY
jgi:PIN domain nuclease of toxin-antitoxin system